MHGLQEFFPSSFKFPQVFEAVSGRGRRYEGLKCNQSNTVDFRERKYPTIFTLIIEELSQEPDKVAGIDGIQADTLEHLRFLDIGHNAVFTLAQG